MQITIDQAVLAERLGVAFRATVGNSTLQIIKWIMIEIDRAGGQLIATSNSLEYFIQARIPASFGLMDECPGINRVCVEGKQLVDIVKTLESRHPIKITFEFMGKSAVTEVTTLVIQSGKSRFKVPTLPVEEFLFPDEPIGEEFVLQCDEFKQALKQTTFATIADDLRPFLQCVLFEFAPSELKLVTTDVNRLAIYRMDVASEMNRQLLVPVKSLKKLADAFYGEVTCKTNGKQLFMISKDSTVVAGMRLVDAQYPRYGELVKGFQDATKTEFLVDTAVLKRMLAKASLIDSKVLLKAIPQTNILNVLSKSGDTAGEFSEELTIEEVRADNTFVIAFNTAFLAEYLKNSPAQKTRVLYSSRDKAVIFDESGDEEWCGNDTMYVLMPLKIEGSVYDKFLAGTN